MARNLNEKGSIFHIFNENSAIRELLHNMQSFNCVGESFDRIAEESSAKNAYFYQPPCRSLHDTDHKPKNGLGKQQGNDDREVSQFPSKAKVRGFSFHS